MKLYSENENYKLYQGNMLDMLEVIDKESIDSVVCDPPYELNFMSKGWDNAGISFQPDTWRKCYEVLKSGGYLLAFGGSRTFHRIACAIEDAGFEIRDTIMWLYGCLSNDTEILTSNGWKNSDTITIGDEIYSLDLEKDIIIRNKCLSVFKYDYDGEMVNLKNNNTNQLLTPNHHCIIKDKIKTQIKGKTKYNTHNYWNYKDAWQIRSQTVKLPLAGNYDGKLEIGNLFAELLGWIISEGTYLKDTNAIMITQSSINQKYVERIRYILGKLRIKYSEYSRERAYKNKTYTEYDFYIGKEAEKEVNKIKELIPNKKLNWNLLELSFTNKEFLIKGLLQGDGAKCDNTLGFSAFYQKDIEQLQVFQALLHLTGKQGWINENKYSCSIHNNPITELQGKHFKDRFVKYKGKYVWCIETEIGNFIAKRDGKIFITGNSGFPKSMDISKQIDKKGGNDYSKQFAKDLKQARESRNLTMKYCDDKYCNSSTNWSWYEGRKDGCRVPDYETYLKIIKEFPELEKYRELIKEAEREVIGTKKSGGASAWINGMNNKENEEQKYTGFSEWEITAPSTDLAKQWQGWGTALKPSFEPIIVARKPFKGSLVDNVIEYGVGGINIDECRVETNGEKIAVAKDFQDINYSSQFGNENFRFKQANTELKELGRFPANTILTYDENDFDEVCGGFPNTKSKGSSANYEKSNTGKIYGFANNGNIKSGVHFEDSGSASRYFYCAKASKKDRDEGLDEFEETKCSMMASNDNIDKNGNFTGMLAGRKTKKRNTHPTVKPTNLMQYLVRLVTPNGGIVLDPFNGSGSTGKAVMYENKERNKNYKYIGIELTEEYLPIAKARIEYVCSLKEEVNPQMSIFDYLESKGE